MFIQKTELIEFDEVAERTRIQKIFKGPVKKLLLQVLDAFVSLDWVACHQLLRSLGQSELEYIHPHIYDVMQARAERNSQAEAYERGSLDGDTRQLDYPRFQVGSFID